MSTAEAPSAATTPPDDADDLRGYYFRLLLFTRPLVLALAGAFAIACGLAGALLAGPAAAAAGLVAGLAVALLIVFGIADSRSEQAFFDVYAARRGMTARGRRPLPPATPLLRRGDERYAERALEGPLGDGVSGRIALYTYETESTDSDGDRQTSYHRFTLGMTEVLDCAVLVPELICRPRVGPRALERLEDAFRSKRRVSLESEALDDRYEIFVEESQDENQVRQVLSPTFIVWLTESAPERFGFEFVNGYLCCYVAGHAKAAAELDAMRAATTAVAGRLRDEALE